MTLHINQQFEQLNQAQMDAVTAPLSHMLISAGAGTGKTRVLTLRYNYLVSHMNADPGAIMAVTFTNKAAQEMKHRLRPFFPVHQLWIGTFHSLGMRILRQHADKISRSKDFSILNTGDQHNIIQKILKNIAPRKAYTAAMVMSAIHQWKQNLFLPDDVLYAPTPIYLTIYKEYQAQLQLMNGFDFDDLLLYSFKLLDNFPEILTQYAFLHVLVDEYQDINYLQYVWLKKFVDNNAYIFCVGDADQAIYEWRGGSVDKILKFSKDFPSAKIIFLEDNYRSTPHILSAASHLIANNQERHKKTLKTHQVHGEKIQIQGLWDSAEEAAFIAQQIIAFHNAGNTLSCMAILVRTGAQTREFEERFTLQHIPYHLVGSTRFYDRLEIKDFLSYLRVVHSETDNIAFERIINVPRRGVGSVTLQQLYALVKERNISLEQAARLWCGTEPLQSVKQTIATFVHKIDRWREQALSLSLDNLAELVLADSGYEALWKAEGIQGETRLENLKELLRAMSSFPTLEDFLEHVCLLQDIDDSARTDGVALMTLHAAKGLEFDIVFLPGWEENIFPHIRCIEESGKKGIEEERRLAYVGITRARKYSFITFSWNRRNHQGIMPCTPSRFIYELPESDVNISLKSQMMPSADSKKRVKHALFGQGTVQNQSGNILTVLFDKHGLKKVVSHFLEFL
jgi:DNA helicase-2/ATP-dependent DNA helicase PcrA